MFANMSADLVIFLGTRIGLYYIFGELFSKDAKLVQVDIEPEEIGRNRSIDLPIFSDIRGFLKACNQVIDDQGISEKLQQGFKGWIETLKKAEVDGKAEAMPNWESDNVPIHPLRLAKESTIS